MIIHPDFVPFTDADLNRIYGQSECSGLEQTMTTVERNKREFTERQSCKTLVESVAGECCGGCESCECDGVAGAEVMDRLRAEEGDHGQV